MQPERIDRYQILSVIGRGGMAIVYLANDPIYHRQVAVKVLPREYLHERQFRQRFQREVKILTNLHHQAMVSIYGYGQYQGQLYLVMPYMRGGSLETRLKMKRSFTLAEIAALMERLANALEAAHLQGIIHRDLKPSNILFDEHGQAFIADFGLARIVDQADRTTLTGSLVLGTPAYMSPEQARGGVELDGRCDVYAMGVILFELLTGKLPFEADTPMQMALKHVVEPVPDILSVKPDLPHRTRKVITKALAKKPDDRYATPREFAEAVKDLVEKEETAASTKVELPSRPHKKSSPPSPAPVQHLSAQIKKKPVRNGAIFLAIAVLAAILLLITRSLSARTQAPVPSTTIPATPLTATTAHAMTTLTRVAGSTPAAPDFLPAGINITAGEEPYSFGETLSARGGPLEVVVAHRGGVDPVGYAYAFSHSIFSVLRADDQTFEILVDWGSQIFVETGFYRQAVLQPNLDKNLQFRVAGRGSCLAMDLTSDAQIQVSCYRGDCSLQVQGSSPIRFVEGEQVLLDRQHLGDTFIQPIAAEEAQAYTAVLPDGSTALACANQYRNAPTVTFTKAAILQPGPTATGKPTRVKTRSTPENPAPEQPTATVSQPKPPEDTLAPPPPSSTPQPPPPTNTLVPPSDTPRPTPFETQRPTPTDLRRPTNTATGIP